MQTFELVIAATIIVVIVLAYIRYVTASYGILTARIRAITNNDGALVRYLPSPFSVFQRRYLRVWTAKQWTVIACSRRATESWIQTAVQRGMRSGK